MKLRVMCLVAKMYVSCAYRKTSSTVAEGRLGSNPRGDGFRCCWSYRSVDVLWCVCIDVYFNNNKYEFAEMHLQHLNISIKLQQF